MARFNDTNVSAAVQPHLKSGEVMRHWAFGVRTPHFLVATVPLIYKALTKNYIVVLTNQRVLVMEMSGDLKFTSVTEYSLDSMPAVTGSVGMLFTKLHIQCPTQPSKVKFHRMGAKNNRSSSMAILEALKAA